MRKAQRNWCSGVPDFDVGACCEVHDGSYEQPVPRWCLWKKVAGDWHLFTCVATRVRAVHTHLLPGDFYADYSAATGKRITLLSRVGYRAAHVALACLYFVGVSTFGIPFWIRAQPPLPFWNRQLRACTRGCSWRVYTPRFLRRAFNIKLRVQKATTCETV